MKRRQIIPALLVAAALTGCGSTKTTTSVKSTTHAGASATTTTTAPTTTTSTTSFAMAQDRNPNQPDYWSPKFENGLVVSCGSNKIARTQSMCNCIVASLQSHHAGAAQDPSEVAEIRRWFQTGSGNALGLKGYALNCGQQ